VVESSTGVTGLSIIRAILGGTRAPQKLAKYRDKQCEASEAEIAQVSNGSYRNEHLFKLKQIYEAWQTFIEIEEGILGLLHVSDMSWVHKVSHPSEVVSKGDKVSCVVLNIDQERKRIALGLR
jgi:polyribonucleotide nucleotidyltransferase